MCDWLNTTENAEIVSVQYIQMDAEKHSAKALYWLLHVSCYCSSCN